MKTKLISFLIRMLAATWRIRIEGTVPQSAAVIAFWHGEMLPVWKYFSFRNAAGVTSLSKDGDILARLLSDWNYQVIRGSSSQGGKEVLENMTRLASTLYVLVTPDGPRGPSHEFKPGALIAAQRAAAPFCFCYVECNRSYRLRKSWDRFMIPLFFSKVRLRFSNALFLNAETSHEEVEQLRQSFSRT